MTPDDDQNGGAAAPAENASDFSVDDAVALLNQGPDKDPPAEPEKAEAEATDAPPSNTEEEQPAEGDEPTEQPASEAEPEADPEPEETYVHGNAKTRLRDGTVVSVSDLKKLADEAREFRAKQPELTARQQEIAAQQAQVAQQLQVFEQVIPHALRVAQANIPPEPDPALRETDPIEHYQQSQRRAAAVQEYQRLAQAEQATRQAAQVQHQQQVQQQQRAYIEAQRAELLDWKPELADPAKAGAFYKDVVVAAAKAVGFTEQDVSNVQDARLIKMAEKAWKYDQLQAQKPKVAAKAANAVPVKAPGPRPNADASRDTKVQELDQRLSKTGSLDDAVALLNSLG
jgi:hypothetical protein